MPAAVEAKICGITTKTALDAALKGGADYVGLVFFAKSPRNIGFTSAAKLAAHARGKAKVVALVVDAGDAQLDAIVAQVQPDMLQLHGKETPARIAEVKAAYGLPVIKAIPVATKEDAEEARAYVKSVDLILFDAKASKGAKLPGGNGLTFDWHALDKVRCDLAFMLSGGLTPHNVAEAIRLTGPRAVDVSSGVERSPGIKDPDLIRRFLHAVKTAKQT